MTSLPEAAGEQIRAANARLAELEARTRHLHDELRLAAFRGDLDRVRGLETATKQVAVKRADLQRERGGSMPWQRSSSGYRLARLNLEIGLRSPAETPFCAVIG